MQESLALLIPSVTSLVFLSTFISIVLNFSDVDIEANGTKLGFK